MVGSPELKKKLPISALVLVLILLAATNALSRQEDKATFVGPYVGQKPPGMTPEVFAPGLVSKEGDQGRLFIAGDGSEVIYWERDTGGRMRILSIVEKGGAWSTPKALPFSENHVNNEPCLSPDGKRLYFVSNRPLSGKGEGEKLPDIWVVEKTAGKWGEPRNLGEPVNRLDIVVQPFMAADGKRYFGGQQADRSAHVWYLGHCGYAVLDHAGQDDLRSDPLPTSGARGIIPRASSAIRHPDRRGAFGTRPAAPACL